MKRTAAGFSLIEAMVIVAIIAILAAVAAPSFQNAINATRVKSAAEAVYGHIGFAKSESIKQNRNLFVTIQGAGTTNWCIGISNASGCNCNTPNSCLFGPAGNTAERNLSSADFSSITLSAANIATEFVFNSRRGSLESIASGTLTITLTGSTGLNTAVQTSPMGSIRICGGNVGGYPAC